MYDKNALPQVGALTGGVNPTAGTDRVQAPMVGSGSTDFWGSQIYYTDNETATEDDRLLEMDHLASTVFEAPNVNHAK